MDKINTAWDIYKNIKEQICFCDTKAAIILAFYGIIFSILIPKFIEDFNSLSKNHVIVGGIIITFLPIIISLYFLFKSLLPRLSFSKTPSLIYINDIITEHDNSMSYYNALDHQLDDPNIHFKDISLQIWDVAYIAKEKYNNVSHALQFLIVSFIFFFVSLFFYILSRN